MAGIFEDLGLYLKGLKAPFLQVQYQPTGVLATLSTGNNRTQTVKISQHQSGVSSEFIVRLQSRVTFAKDPNVVWQLLEANGNLEFGGFGLDTSTTPNVIDVLYDVLGDDLDFPTMAEMVQRIGNLADAYELQLTGRDEF